MLADRRSYLLRLSLLAGCVVWWSLSSTASLTAPETKSTEVLSDGLAAWSRVYSVLTSPRCINCHTATN